MLTPSLLYLVCMNVPSTCRWRIVLSLKTNRPIHINTLAVQNVPNKVAIRKYPWYCLAERFGAHVSPSHKNVRFKVGTWKIQFPLPVPLLENLDWGRPHPAGYRTWRLDKMLDFSINYLAKFLFNFKICKRLQHIMAIQWHFSYFQGLVLSKF